MFSSFQPGVPEQFERIHLAKDGRRIPVEISRHHIDIGGKPYGLSIVRDITKRKQLEAEREQLIKDLQQAVQEVKTLKGILPTCAYCKKIRDENGAWHQFEVYIRDRSEAEFSHGICPECALTLLAKT